MSDELPREIRCVLVPVGNLRLLLPNATIAEVITQSTPEPVADAPEWLLGRIAWRGWRVPVVSFTQLSGIEEGDPDLSARVAVLKALGDNPKLPFIAVMTLGFPRLTTLNAELILPTHDGRPLPPGVRAHVLVRDDVAMIPDMEWIEAQLLQILDDADLVPAPDAGANADADDSEFSEDAENSEASEEAEDSEQKFFDATDSED